jgi:hypothetical protein
MGGRLLASGLLLGPLLFDTCERDLDVAKKMDPASESLPEVTAMRREIDRWRHSPDANPE